MTDIEQAIAATTGSVMAKCRACEGDGWYVEASCCGRGTVNRCCGDPDPIQVDCEQCNGSGKIAVGVFDLICAHHCTMCEGQDHHWSYDGDEDEAGEPLMGCRHCPALRPHTDDDDDDEGDYPFTTDEL